MSSLPNQMMMAARVHQYGGPEVIRYEEIPRPRALDGQLIVRVIAAGVGPWDAWVRAGKSALPQPLPLTLGSDISGVVDSVSPGVTSLRVGDEVYGVTNAQFTGGYAEFAAASAAMMAPKPRALTHVQAASIPVVASTAWQMLFEHAHVDRGERVLIHGAGGNVGAFAVQLARRAGAYVIATGSAKERDRVMRLGAEEFIDLRSERFEEHVKAVDAVIDTIGGDIQTRSFTVLRRGGVMVSAVAPPDQKKAAQFGVRAVFFLVSVTSAGLTKLAEMFDAHELEPNVGEVLPLSEARLAHEILAGKAHKNGKMVLTITN